MKKQATILEKDHKRYLFLIPGILTYICIVVIPLAYSIYLSFFAWNGIDIQKKYVGFNNYIELFKTDYAFSTSLTNNIIWIILSLLIIVPLSISLALLINKKFKGRTIVRCIIYFPYVLSGALVGVIWIWVYHYEYGLYNGIVNLIGRLSLKKAWLSDPNTALFACFLAEIWRGIGQPMMLFLAGLQTVNQELVEAAKVDGANSFQAFIHVTIPQLRETFIIVIATQVINALKVYDLIRVMTGGGPANSTETLATWMITKSFDFHNLGSGSAIAIIMVLMLMVIIIPYVSVVSRDE